MANQVSQGAKVLEDANGGTFVGPIAMVGFLAIVGLTIALLMREGKKRRDALDDAEKKVDYLTRFDPLTGLPNRFQFEERLVSMLLEDAHVSLLMLDVDDFRKLNAGHGSKVGDIALKEIAFRILTLAKQEGAFAARLAGDEFAVLFKGSDASDVRSFARKLRTSCSDPIMHARQQFSLTACVGCVTGGALSSETSPDRSWYLHAADYSLGAARRKGANSIVMYDAELEKRHTSRREMLSSFSRAIREKELKVFFQPQVDAQTDQVNGFEALVRWERQGGFVPASELVSAVEEQGMVTDLDCFVLSEAVSVISDWNKRHRTDYSLSVNISGFHLQARDIAGFVQKCLHEHGMRPDRLTIEVTESAELNGKGKAAEAIERIRGLGCRVLIDDFGSGYASFGHLKGFHFEEVKIDRSFVEGIEVPGPAREILAALISLPTNLGQSVVVEGIETRAQDDIVRSLGANLRQGSLLGEPAPALDWLADTTYTQRRELSGGCSAGPVKPHVLAEGSTPSGKTRAC